MQTRIPLKKLLGLHIQQGHFPKNGSSVKAVRSI